MTPGKRGKGAKRKAFEEEQAKTPAQRRAAMTWAQRLKRVFGIDIETCLACGGALRISACIEDPVMIKKILTHRDSKKRFRRTGPVAALSGATAGEFVLIEPPVPHDQC